MLSFSLFLDWNKKVKSAAEEGAEVDKDLNHSLPSNSIPVQLASNKSCEDQKSVSTMESSSSFKYEKSSSLPKISASRISAKSEGNQRHNQHRQLSKHRPGDLPGDTAFVRVSKSQLQYMKDVNDVNENKCKVEKVGISSKGKTPIERVSRSQLQYMKDKKCASKNVSPLNELEQETKNDEIFDFASRKISHCKSEHGNTQRRAQSFGSDVAFKWLTMGSPSEKCTEAWEEPLGSAEETLSPIFLSHQLPHEEEFGKKIAFEFSSDHDGSSFSPVVERLDSNDFSKNFFQDSIKSINAQDRERGQTRFGNGTQAKLLRSKNNVRTIQSDGRVKTALRNQTKNNESTGFKFHSQEEIVREKEISIGTTRAALSTPGCNCNTFATTNRNSTTIIENVRETEFLDNSATTSRTTTNGKTPSKHATTSVPLLELHNGLQTNSRVTGINTQSTATTGEVCNNIFEGGLEIDLSTAEVVEVRAVILSRGKSEREVGRKGKGKGYTEDKKSRDISQHTGTLGQQHSQGSQSTMKLFGLKKDKGSKSKLTGSSNSLNFSFNNKSYTDISVTPDELLIDTSEGNTLSDEDENDASIIVDDVGIQTESSTILDDDALEAEAKLWKSTVDPQSGKTYYYHVETRETQWRKPLCMSTPEERKSAAEKDKQQRDFFSAMEANILNSMSAGVFSPSSSSACSLAGDYDSGHATPEPLSPIRPLGRPPLFKNVSSPRKSMTKGSNHSDRSLSKPNLVRTISTMEDSVLKTLVKRVPSHRSILKKPNYNAEWRNPNDDSCDAPKNNKVRFGGIRFMQPVTRLSSRRDAFEYDQGYEVAAPSSLLQRQGGSLNLSKLNGVSLQREDSLQLCALSPAGKKPNRKANIQREDSLQLNMLESTAKTSSRNMFNPSFQREDSLQLNMLEQTARTSSRNMFNPSFQREDSLQLNMLEQTARTSSRNMFNPSFQREDSLQINMFEQSLRDESRIQREDSIRISMLENNAIGSNRNVGLLQQQPSFSLNSNSTASLSGGVQANNNNNVVTGGSQSSNLSSSFSGFPGASSAGTNDDSGSFQYGQFDESKFDLDLSEQELLALDQLETITDEMTNVDEDDTEYDMLAEEEGEDSNSRSNNETDLLDGLQVLDEGEDESNADHTETEHSEEDEIKKLRDNLEIILVEETSAKKAVSAPTSITSSPLPRTKSPRPRPRFKAASTRSLRHVTSDPLKMSRPAMVRRNTCGTLYVSSTLAAPDKDATIKCVCGVYRAHLLQSDRLDEEMRESGIYDDEYDAQYSIFNDLESQRNSKDSNFDSRSEGIIPTLDEVTNFYRDVFGRAQMETDCIIMSLIYVERLIKNTGGSLRPRPCNWRSILFSCMVLSSKVWDDLSMWNADFSQTCPAGVRFTLKRVNELELAVLFALDYHVKVLSSEYAKYYFLLRSMLIKSGLASEEMTTNSPLDIEGARRLQHLSAQYEKQANANSDIKKISLTRSKTTGSSGVISNSLSKEMRSKVGLEQLVQL